MAMHLEEAIARVPLWKGATDIRTTPLGGGITNRNYRVDVHGESFVVRIAGYKTELLGIDRRNEYAANQAAAGIGLAPDAVFFIEPEGYLVTRFLAARPVPREEMGRPENIRRMAAALRRLHASPGIPGAFSPFRTVERYAETARQYGVALPPDFNWMTARLNEIETALRSHPYTLCLCHNDLLNENILLQEPGSGGEPHLRIIDWEYAGMGDPAFDLANFAVHHGLDAEQERGLLEAYYRPGLYTISQPPLPSHGFGTGEPDRKMGSSGAQWVHAGNGALGAGEWGVRYARHRLLKIVSDAREAMWSMVQLGISELEFDYRAYARRHLDRMAESIRDPRYTGWLAAFDKGSHGQDQSRNQVQPHL